MIEQELHEQVALGCRILAATGHDDFVSVLLERAAHQQMLTHAFGGPRHFSDDEEALRKRATVWSERQRAALWDYFARRW